MSPLNSPKLNPLDHYVSRKFKRSITGTIKNRRYRRNQGNAANDSLTQGTIDRAEKEFKKH